MNAAAIARRRSRFRRHTLERAAQRGVELTARDIRRMERTLEQSRPAFEQPGDCRYRIRVKTAAARICVLYDTALGCVLTVWRWRPSSSVEGDERSASPRC